MYQGVFEARKIKGLWVVAQGLVYDTFDIEKHTCSHKIILDKIAKNGYSSLSEKEKEYLFKQSKK